MDNQQNLVAIFMVTYNHEPFIAKAIESIVMQETKFSYTLFIGEDCSTDNTRKICIDFARQMPHKIKLILQEYNVGGMRNALDVYKACFTSGAEFIAMCEGDDYWTDPLKLQKQVDFLQHNPGYSICYHRVMEIREDGLKPEQMNKANQAATYTLTDLAKGNMMHTPSVVFRNHFKGKVPDWFSSLPIGDYPLHILNALQGKIYYMPEFMAVYRVHAGGIWSQMQQRLKSDKVIEMHRILLAKLELPTDVQNVLQENADAYTHFLLTDSFTHDTRSTFFKLFIKYWRLNGKTTRLWLRTRLKALIIGTK